MDPQKEWTVWAMYFSATGTTAQVVRCVAHGLSAALNAPVRELNFTPAAERKTPPAFGENDLVVCGLPTYAGRLPNLLLPYLKAVQGGGAWAIPVVLYGNRNYDDSLIELRDLLQADGFYTLAAGAFVGQHAFSDTLAAGRPNEEDLALADELACRAAEKLLEGAKPGEPVAVRGQSPLRPYYQPRDRMGAPIDIRKVKPKVGEGCTKCGWCALVCPMEAIDPADVQKVPGICIKCNACVKGCPEHARYFDDAGYLCHRAELEAQYGEARNMPELFV